MGHAAEKINGGLGIAVLELSLGRAHGTHRLQLAFGALGRPGDFFPANAAKSVPGVAQRSRPEIELVSVRKATDAHPSVRIDRKRVDASAAVIEVVLTSGGIRRLEVRFGEYSPLVHALRIFEIEGHDLFRRQANR